MKKSNLQTLNQDAVVLVIQPQAAFALGQEALARLQDGSVSDVYERRRILRKKISAFCNKFNIEHKDEILAPFREDRESEMEVVLKTNMPVPAIIKEMEQEFGPMLVGVGYGKLHAYSSSNVDMCDGPAFWDAREIINTKKEQAMQAEKQK